MKIQSITLQNFKKFKNYEVICRPHNILIGRNNAGKSTILDALRIVCVFRGDPATHTDLIWPGIPGHPATPL